MSGANEGGETLGLNGLSFLSCKGPGGTNMLDGGVQIRVYRDRHGSAAVSRRITNCRKSLPVLIAQPDDDLGREPYHCNYVPRLKRLPFFKTPQCKTVDAPFSRQT